MFNTKIVISALFSVSLMGCGGGGGDETPATTIADSIDTAEISSNETLTNETLTNEEFVVIEEDRVVAVQQEEVYVEPPAVATIEMDQLVASDDFTFTSKEEITVALDLSDTLSESGQSGLRARASIYSEYTLLSNGQFYPTQKSLVIAGDLDNGQFNSTFTRLKDQSEYLIDVWFYNGDDPIQLEKTIVANTLTW